MNKKELEEVNGQFAGFIQNIYASAGLLLPSQDAEWNYEEESMICFNAIKAIGRQEMARMLILAEKNEEEKAKLVALLESNPC
jgi:hypothetical protein